MKITNVSITDTVLLTINLNLPGSYITVIYMHIYTFF